MINCGHCHGQHVTVASVRACSEKFGGRSAPWPRASTRRVSGGEAARGYPRRGERPAVQVGRLEDDEDRLSEGLDFDRRRDSNEDYDRVQENQETLRKRVGDEFDPYDGPIEYMD